MPLFVVWWNRENMVDNFPKNVQIRPAKYSELETIAQNSEGNLTYDAFSKLLRHMYETEPQYILVAEVRNNLAGHLIATSKYERLLLKIALSGELLCLFKGAKEKPPIDPNLLFGAQWGPLTVYPPFRKKGIGRMLIKRMANDFQANKNKCWTKETNIPARRLFEEVGFNVKKKSRGWVCYEMRLDKF